jgi:stage III sporulation protein SpoIIIAA
MAEQATAPTRKLPPTEHIVTDDLDQLLEALPPRIGDALRERNGRDDLLEVVMDLGRLPEARYPGREVVLSHDEVTEADLEYVVDRIGEFGADNRAGIERTLHRISCIRNRRGKIVGLTCRIGRAVYGTIRVIEDLVVSGKSILFLGRPGVGKTTMLREVARVLADDANKRVVIVDTSNEIAGDGDIPHPAIGSARRMQVATPAMQHAVMIEAVENHMPEVIVIDEIGTELEAAAARTIAERGVQLVGTAHGNTLENLMMNPTLSDLIGGIQSVTLGDEEARRRGTQKSILERKAPPTFDVVVEIQSWQRVAIHPDVAATVDAMLRGYEAPPEVRQLTDDGAIETVEYARPEEYDAAAYRGGPPPTLDLGLERPRRQARGGERSIEPGAGGRRTNLYPFGVSRAKLEQAAHESGVAVNIVRDVREADAVITLRNYYRRKPAAIREAEERAVPIYVIKSNTAFQMEQVLLQFAQGRARPDPITEVYREAEDAVARVINEGRPVELAPQNSYIRRLQHQIAGRYNLESRSAGKEPNRRVRILPFAGGPSFGGDQE